MSRTCNTKCRPTFAHFYCCWTGTFENERHLKYRPNFSICNSSFLSHSSTCSAMLFKNKMNNHRVSLSISPLASHQNRWMKSGRRINRRFAKVMAKPNGVQRDDGQHVVGTTEGIDPSSPFFCLGLH